MMGEQVVRVSRVDGLVAITVEQDRRHV